jgi:PHD/YefM family antitoxin component YafN of YafNO toxin-antitoxin module
MKTLAVPTANITDVKKSPGKVFELAAKNDNGVYIFNRGRVAGVMLTREQYENLSNSIEMLKEKLFDAEVAARIANTDMKTFSDAEVRGGSCMNNQLIDELDGWQ